MTLELCDVTVRYGRVSALDAVSLEVSTGEVLALIGPSGCGKSTLLRVVAGLVASDSGTVMWDGTSLASLGPEQRDVGFLFQDHALFTDRSVGANIAFGLRMRGVARADRRRRVDELLEMVGLVGYRDRDVAKLSGGEAQRVALARALAPEPRLLLLDEPLAALDRARRDELLNELSRLLQDLGQTAIYVTHDQHEAFAIGDRLGVLRAGKLERVAAPVEVWRDPRTASVASFMGHRTVTIIDGRRVAVRSDAITMTDRWSHSDTGRLRRATVERCQFAGDRFGIELDLGDDEPLWHAWSHEPLVVGQLVGVEVDLSRVAPLEDGT